MARYPISGWPEEVIEQLATEIHRLTGNHRVNEFYIGRTNDLTATRSRHDADEVIALYQTESVENAITVEDGLIDLFYDNVKCSNEHDHGGGGASDEFINYVYVAVWYR